MRLENFLQFIVPMSILAIWALTSLFNREAQPLPPRPNRPPVPPGTRPTGVAVPPMRQAERRPEPAPRDPAQRWQLPAPGDRPGAPRRPPVRPDEEIVILESGPRRPNPPAPQRPGQRRGARTKPAAGAPAAKRAEPSSPRALTASMAQDAAPQIGRFLELNPLARLHSPLSTQESHDVARAAAPDSLRTVPTTTTVLSRDVASLLNSPDKLREAIILNEILQPPLALRAPRRA